MGILAHFLELHEIDWEIYQLEEEKEKHPRLLARQLQKLQKAQAQHSHCVEESKRKQVNIREQEGLLGSLDVVIQKKQVQVNEAKNNREYTALGEEISAKKQEKSALEENILKLIEESEQYKGKIKEHQQKTEQIQEECKKVEKEVKAVLADIENQLAVLVPKQIAKREEVAQLDSKSLDIYERVLRTRTGKAMAPVEEEACGYCRLQLLPNELSALLSGKIFFCKGCERLLYIPGHC